MKKMITAIQYEIEIWKKYKPFQKEIITAKKLLLIIIIILIFAYLWIN